MRANHSILWGGDLIAFSVERTENNALRISVNPSGEVLVFAPASAREEDVVSRVRRRGGWIARRIRHFERWRPRTPNRQYLAGETHLYLGRQFRLRLEIAEQRSVSLVGDRILMTSPEADGAVNRRTLMDHWYKAEAHRVFPARVQVIVSLFLRFGVHPPRLIIRPMSRRWGSFTARGRLVLNVDLVRTAVACIDYVIAHELAHAVEPNHKSRWQDLMDIVMPDWQIRKAQLEARLV